MSHDAIALLAEPREVNEQALFEDRGKWAVEIVRLGEAPHLLDDAGRRRCRTKDVREYTEAPSDFGFDWIRWGAGCFHSAI
jgi:hypothetical protein